MSGRKYWKKDKSVLKLKIIDFKSGICVFERVTVSKELIIRKDLYIIIAIPQAKDKNQSSIQVNRNSLKILIKNLRTGAESVSSTPNSKLVSMQDLASFDFDIFKHFNSSVKHIGNISPALHAPLRLLGLEGGDTTNDMENESVVDKEANENNTNDNTANNEFDQY